MHQTTCQIAKETGIHHPSVYSIIHRDFQLISLKKRRAQELTTATVYILVRLAARVTRQSNPRMHQNPPFSVKNANFSPDPSPSTVRPPIMKFWIRYCQQYMLCVVIVFMQLTRDLFEIAKFLLQFNQAWPIHFRFYQYKTTIFSIFWQFGLQTMTYHCVSLRFGKHSLFARQIRPHCDNSIYTDSRKSCLR